MKKFPGLDAKDLAKKAGEVWAAMTAEERAPWKTKRDLNGKEAETQETQQTQETQATQDTAVTEISTLETTQEVDGTQMDAGEPQPSAIEMEA